MRKVELLCPMCSKTLRMSDEHLGKMVRCPACRETFPTLPDSAASPSGNHSTAGAGSDGPIVFRPDPKSGILGTAEEPIAEKPVVFRPSAKDDSPKRNVKVPTDRRPGATAAGPCPEKPAVRASPIRKSRRQQPARRRRTAEPSADAWDQKSEDAWLQDDEFPGEDVFDGYEDPFEAAPPPRTRRRRKSDLPGRIARGLLVMCLIALAVTSVSGLGYFLYRHLPDISGNSVDMSYMPEKVAGILHVSMSDVSSSAFVTSLRSQNPTLDQSLSAGFRTDDIRSVTMAFWPGSDSSMELPGVFSMTPWNSGSAGTSFMMVVRLSRDVRPSEIALQPDQDYKGTAIFRTGDKYCWMPNSSTLVMSDQQQIRAAVDRGNKEYRHPQFDFADASGHVFLAMTGKGTTSSAGPGNPSGLRIGPAQDLANSFDRHAKGVSLNVRFTSRMDLQVQVLCNDDSAARQLETDLNNGLSTARTQLASMASSPMLQDKSQPLISVLNSIHVSRGGSTVTVVGTVEQSLIDTFSNAGR